MSIGGDNGVGDADDTDAPEAHRGLLASGESSLCPGVTRTSRCAASAQPTWGSRSDFSFGGNGARRMLTS